MREEFLKRFWNSTIISVSASTLAVVLGSLAAYGLPLIIVAIFLEKYIIKGMAAGAVK